MLKISFAIAQKDGQRAIPNIAKDPKMVQAIETAVKHAFTRHQMIHGDSRAMEAIPDQSVHLAVTSPPYWILKEYPPRDGQLGKIEDYEVFLKEGDVCLPRRQFGRHVVFPLNASIQEHCRCMGFDNLTPIIWYKIANAKFESNRCTNFLGKPYEPNAIIKNDIEYILLQSC